MNIQDIHHCSLIVSDTETALHFYHDVLGMPVNPDRPDLGYKGAWLDVGTRQIHLLELPNPDPVSGRPEHGGRDRHVAFHIDNINKLVRVLEQEGVLYSLSKSARKALFCRDPDGNALEFIQTG
jgi:glyoxylase I family protein